MTSSGPSLGDGVGPVEPVDHAEDDEQGRLQQVRDHGGEPVVVAELDLVDADRVVLVDDRDGVPLEEGVERVPHVQVAGTAVEVFMGQQELCGVPAVPAQALVVGADQVRLADRGGGLELRQVVGPAVHAELAHARADGAGADQRDLAARVHDRADLLGEVVNPVGVEGAVWAGEDARPDLDDPRASREHDLVADQVAEGRRGRSPRPRFAIGPDV